MRCMVMPSTSRSTEVTVSLVLRNVNTSSPSTLVRRDDACENSCHCGPNFEQHACRCRGGADLSWDFGPTWWLRSLLTDRLRARRLDVSSCARRAPQWLGAPRRLPRAPQGVHPLGKGVHPLGMRAAAERFRAVLTGWRMRVSTLWLVPS